MTQISTIWTPSPCKKHPRTKLVSNWKFMRIKATRMKKALWHDWDCPKCVKINKLSDLVGEPITAISHIRRK